MPILTFCFRLWGVATRVSKRTGTDDPEGRKISYTENYKDAHVQNVQNKPNNSKVNKKISSNWKILPLLLDKIALGVFCGLEIYFYFVYIPQMKFSCIYVSKIRITKSEAPSTMHMRTT